MRTIFVIGILLVCAFMAGWFTIHRDDEGTTIRFDRDEIRGDTRQAIERGRDFLDRDDAQANEQIAQQPYQTYVENAPAGYDSQGYQQRPSTDPEYQSPQYQDPRYQSQTYPPRNY